MVGGRFYKRIHPSFIVCLFFLSLRHTHTHTGQPRGGGSGNTLATTAASHTDVHTHQAPRERERKKWVRSSHKICVSPKAAANQRSPSANRRGGHISLRCIQPAADTCGERRPPLSASSSLCCQHTCTHSGPFSSRCSVISPSRPLFSLLPSPIYLPLSLLQFPFFVFLFF